VRAAPACLLPLLLPAAALAGGTEVDAFALAVLAQPETHQGGSLIGATASRATWYFLGDLRPLLDPAMAVFSTGTLGLAPLPGDDLAAVGVADDASGLNLSLASPSWARSLRVGYRLLVPDTLGAALELDRATLSVRGDTVALDAYTQGPIGPGFPGLRGDDGLIGTVWAGGLVTPWLEAVVPVSGLQTLPIRVEVRDGSSDPGGDIALLVDDIRFDRGIPWSVRPGPVPLLLAVEPARSPAGVESLLVVSGRNFPPDLTVSRMEGDDEIVLTATWRSAERIDVALPPTDTGAYALRLGWGDAHLTYEEALTVREPVLRVDAIAPAVALPAGGGLVRIDGDGFYGVNAVRIGAADTPFRALSATRIEAVVPPSSAAEDDVEVETVSGRAVLGRALRRSQREPVPERAPIPLGPQPAGCATMLLLPLRPWGRRRR
jgi:hypothetical protein